MFVVIAVHARLARFSAAEAIQSPWQVEYRLVADEQPLIEAAIIELVRGDLSVRVFVL